MFYDFQYGFREKHSVMHALIDLTTLTNDAIQNKNYAALLLMDRRKAAFDTVSHQILQQKSFHYCIRSCARDLIKSYPTRVFSIRVVRLFLIFVSLL